VSALRFVAAVDVMLAAWTRILTYCVKWRLSAV